MQRRIKGVPFAHSDNNIQIINCGSQAAVCGMRIQGCYRAMVHIISQKRALTVCTGILQLISKKRRAPISSLVDASTGTRAFFSGACFELASML